MFERTLYGKCDITVVACIYICKPTFRQPMPASPYDKILGKQPVFFLPEKD